jgi:hypothetical protein
MCLFLLLLPVSFCVFLFLPLGREIALFFMRVSVLRSSGRLSEIEKEAEYERGGGDCF